jgi:hypothetical protein
MPSSFKKRFTGLHWNNLSDNFVVVKYWDQFSKIVKYLVIVMMQKCWSIVYLVVEKESKSCHPKTYQSNFGIMQMRGTFNKIAKNPAMV